MRKHWQVCDQPGGEAALLRQIKQIGWQLSVMRATNLARVEVWSV